MAEVINSPVCAPPKRLPTDRPSVMRRIDALEAGIKRDLVEVDLPVAHHFSKDVYAREMFIPKGTVLTGKIHKHENLNIMSKGELSILMEDGSIKRVKAPFTVVSPPGTRRVAFAHEDTIWTTIHGTPLTDLDEIESEFVAQNDVEYLQFVESQKLIAFGEKEN